MPTPLFDNRQLGPDVARANLLTNGGFEIWQRGNGPFTANAAYCADRWSINLVGTDTLSVSRDVTNMDTAFGSNVCAACTFTLGTGAGGTFLAGNGHALGDGQQIANRTVSLSVRVRTSVASAVRVAIYNGATYSYSGYHSGSGVYETLTVTATMGASGASLGFVAVYFAASCTAYLDNAMLVVGSQAADYVPLHPADDRARCLRYYQWYTLNIRGYQSAGYSLELNIPMKAVMAVTPTVTITSGGQRTNVSAPAVRTATTECTSYFYGVSALGDATALQEVYALEANP